VVESEAATPREYDPVDFQLEVMLLSICQNFAPPGGKI
jgi:hypothetical protein